MSESSLIIKVAILGYYSVDYARTYQPSSYKINRLERTFIAWVGGTVAIQAARAVVCRWPSLLLHQNVPIELHTNLYLI